MNATKGKILFAAIATAIAASASITRADDQPVVYGRAGHSGRRSANPAVVAVAVPRQRAQRERRGVVRPCRVPGRAGQREVDGSGSQGIRRGPDPCTGGLRACWSSAAVPVLIFAYGRCSCSYEKEAGGIPPLFFPLRDRLTHDERQLSSMRCAAACRHHLCRAPLSDGCERRYRTRTNGRGFCAVRAVPSDDLFDRSFAGRLRAAGRARACARCCARR